MPGTVRYHDESARFETLESLRRLHFRDIRQPTNYLLCGYGMVCQRPKFPHGLENQDLTLCKVGRHGAKQLGSMGGGFILVSCETLVY